MYNQEELFQLIYDRKWNKILDVLYKEQKSISGDALLKNAATTFENEFLRTIKSSTDYHSDIVPVLEKLYLIHNGGFYRLAEKNYERLIIEIVSRADKKKAYNYAKVLPENDLCKKTIQEYESQINKSKENEVIVPQKSWIEIYNRLFELINEQGNAATYFSGPRFLNVIRKYKPYYPDYQQFINARNGAGKSTSRKIYYYDILMELEDKERIEVVKDILEIVSPHNRTKVAELYTLLGVKTINVDIVENINQIKEGIENIGSNESVPCVFISYSWDNEEHKKWVLTLANSLRENGVDVILDRYELKAGKNLTYFVEESINRADRIIIIFTPNYKLKADKRKGGVGYEYSILNAELYKNQTQNEKIIPVLRSGNVDESIPQFMQNFIHINMVNDENYHVSYQDLLREVHDEPAIVKPAIGKKPKF